jgi:hypothetical protein
VWLATWSGPIFGAPVRDRILAEPYREAAALAQARVIFRPVQHPALSPGDVMATGGLGFERHDGSTRGNGTASYFTARAQRDSVPEMWVRATTPRRIQIPQSQSVAGGFDTSGNPQPVESAF